MGLKEEVKSIKIYSPLGGEIIPISKVPDDTFSKKMIGDGVAIIPKENMVYAPCDINFIDIFENKNAFMFETEENMEVLVYLGVETVKLEGNGFTKLVEKGESVKKGEKVIEIDLDFIKKNAQSEISSIIVSSMEKVLEIKKSIGRIKAGDLLMEVFLK